MAQSTEIAPLAAANTARFAAPAEFWHYFSVNRGAVIGLFVFILLVVVAVFAPLLAPHAPDMQDKTAFLLPPVWQGRQGGISSRHRSCRARHPFAPDLRRAVLAADRRRGGRHLRSSTGIALGLLAGYFRGWVDALIMRLMDLILAFPSLLLALVLVAILGPGLFNAMLAIALVLQPHFARLTRAAVMAEKNREYVVVRQGGGRRPSPADACHHPAELPGAAHRPGDAVILGRHPRARPPSASSAWVRSRRRPNGARCWRPRASSSCAPGGW